MNYKNKATAFISLCLYFCWFSVDVCHYRLSFWWWAVLCCGLFFKWLCSFKRLIWWQDKWNLSSNSCLHNIKWILYLFANATARGFQTIFQSNGSWTQWPQNLQTLESYGAQRLPTWNKNNNCYLVLQMQMVSRWNTSQTQSLALCSWWSTNLGTRLLGYLCTHCNVGQCPVTPYYCINSWSRIQDHQFHTCISAGWFRRYSVKGFFVNPVVISDKNQRCDVLKHNKSLYGLKQAGYN